MTKLKPEICFRIRNARRAEGISQSTLAEEVGCKQSALSMFEQGDGTKLNDLVIEKLAKRFDIDLIVETRRDTEERKDVFALTGHGVGFCPNPHCPSNHSYEVSGRIFFTPNRLIADPVGGKFCAVCGEILEKKCPNCGATVHDGAVCSYCGDSYISCI